MPYLSLLQRICPFWTKDSSVKVSVILVFLSFNYMESLLGSLLGREINKTVSRFVLILHRQEDNKAHSWKVRLIEDFILTLSSRYNPWFNLWSLATLLSLEPQPCLNDGNLTESKQCIGKPFKASGNQTNSFQQWEEAQTKGFI